MLPAKDRGRSMKLLCLVFFSMKNITINTDAGFLPNDKIGSWAYWIVSDGLLLKGSGLFKDICKNSTDAETKAMVNAVAILLKTNFDFSGVKNIIFNRDNINAKGGHNGYPPQAKLSKLVRQLKRMCGAPYPNVLYKHVKAHSDIDDKRSYVNRWCDQQCKFRLKEWRNKNKNQEINEANTKVG